MLCINTYNIYERRKACEPGLSGEDGDLSTSSQSTLLPKSHLYFSFPVPDMYLVSRWTSQVSRLRLTHDVLLSTFCAVNFPLNSPPECFLRIWSDWTLPSIFLYFLQNWRSAQHCILIQSCRYPCLLSTHSSIIWEPRPLTRLLVIVLESLAQRPQDGNWLGIRLFTR